jgi:cellulase/cellobiase CelA1
MSANQHTSYRSWLELICDTMLAEARAAPCISNRGERTEHNPSPSDCKQKAGHVGDSSHKAKTLKEAGGPTQAWLQMLKHVSSSAGWTTCAVRCAETRARAKSVGENG